MWLMRKAAIYDVSLDAVSTLRDTGYTTVKWNSQGAADTQEHFTEVMRYNDPSIIGEVKMCQDWNGSTWNIDDFLSETQSAYGGWGIVGRTHPGDKNCILEISGEGKEPMRVNTTGVI